MKVLMIIEYDLPKDEAKLKTFYEYASEKRPYLVKKWEEYKMKTSVWGDSSGHVVRIGEMEVEDYAKMMNDEEYQKVMIRICRFLNNVCIRYLGQYLRVPPQ